MHDVIQYADLCPTCGVHPSILVVDGTSLTVLRSKLQEDEEQYRCDFRVCRTVVTE
jgi:hypothetical protein